ncbi:ROK family transcriptional regulator [Pseudonocardia sp. GCM10023141]|uniref:ROK family transcriptional regulator n=1 Tax=Pseudonocardia sp. GCM10023141 TaxID=3252653 RepID=UPI003614DECC
MAGSSSLLRAINVRAALAHLLERGRLTRGELRDLTGLSKPTASEVIRQLQDAGLAIVAGHTSGGPGPNAEIYAPEPNASFHAAFSVRDVGGRDEPNLLAAIADLTGTVRARLATSIDFRTTTAVEALSTTLATLIADAGVPADRLDHVQLGVPGSYDPLTDVIRYVDVPGWSAPGLITRIRTELDVPVDVENDVNLAAIAERAHGIAADTSAFALLWLGSEGLGLATDLDGTLLRGARGGAGEIGYMPVGLPDPASTGRRRDFTDLVGGDAVLRLAADHGLVAASSPAAMRIAADGGHEPFLDELAERIAFGLAAVVAVLDPPLLVLAGEVGQAGGEALSTAVARAASTASPLHCEIAPSGVSDDAVLLGALRSGLTTTRERLLDTASGATGPMHDPTQAARLLRST